MTGIGILTPSTAFFKLVNVIYNHSYRDKPFSQLVILPKRLESFQEVSDFVSTKVVPGFAATLVNESSATVSELTTGIVDVADVV